MVLIKHPKCSMIIKSFNLESTNAGPEKELFDTSLSLAWESKLLTSNGQLAVLSKKRIKDFFALDNIILTNNGTTPLLIALKKLGSRSSLAVFLNTFSTMKGKSVSLRILSVSFPLFDALCSFRISSRLSR
jgi:hypothetical protein